MSNLIIERLQSLLDYDYAIEESYNPSEVIDDVEECHHVVCYSIFRSVPHGDLTLITGPHTFDVASLRATLRLKIFAEIEAMEQREYTPTPSVDSEASMDQHWLLIQTSELLYHSEDV